MVSQALPAIDVTSRNVPTEDEWSHVELLWSLLFNESVDPCRVPAEGHGSEV